MEMKKNLSDGEWRLMRALWERGASSVGELVRLLQAETGWNKSTIHIMLSRMAEKGAVRVDDSARPKRYVPLWERDSAAVRETRSFLSRVYGGSIGSMMTCMVGSQELSQEEIDELYAILRAAERGGEHDA